MFLPDTGWYHTKKLQLDEEKKRILLRPLDQEYDVIVLEDYELMAFRILGEMEKF